MTFLELQDLTLTYLDDLSAGYFTRPQIKRFLNNALKELHKELCEANNNWYLSCRKAVMTANQGCYLLPSDFFSIHRLDIITANPGIVQSEARVTVDRLTPQEIRRVEVNVGLPIAYFIKKYTLEFKPVPDRAYNMELLYSYNVGEMTEDNETPDAPEEYHQYICLLAVQDGFTKDQREPTSQFMAKLQSYRDLMQATSVQRDKTRGRHVVITDGFNSGTWY